MICTIDKEKLKNRSLKVLLSSRMCPDCKSEDEDEMMRLIREHCSKREDFLPPLLLLKEVIFRIVLKNGSIDIEKLEEEVKSYLLKTKDTRRVSRDFLIKVIEKDNFYGLSLKES